MASSFDHHFDRRRARRGFTLTEILVALGLFMIGSVGVLAVFGAGAMSARDAVDTVDAATLLDSVLEDIRATFHDEPKYHPADSEIEGIPDLLLQANGGEMPARAMDIVLPSGWPGHAEIDSVRSTPRLAKRMTYSIFFEALPNTLDPATGRPTCVMAHVTVYWLRASSVFSRTGSIVLTLP
ncbi:MAG: prepilin-type N-terminal cleavage/methylation domain-containing protein [Planctomycetota bacterium]